MLPIIMNVSDNLAILISIASLLIMMWKLFNFLNQIHEKVSKKDYQFYISSAKDEANIIRNDLERLTMRVVTLETTHKDLSMYTEDYAKFKSDIMHKFDSLDKDVQEKLNKNQFDLFLKDFESFKKDVASGMATKQDINELKSLIIDNLSKSNKP